MEEKVKAVKTKILDELKNRNYATMDIMDFYHIVNILDSIEYDNFNALLKSTIENKNAEKGDNYV